MAEMAVQRLRTANSTVGSLAIALQSLILNSTVGFA